METNPFYFYTSSNLVKLTGEKANTLEELLTLLRRCTGSAIFYHVLHGHGNRYFVIEKYHSDFARWISTSLDEEPLAKKLGVLDVRDFTSIRSLRESIIKIVEEYVHRYPQSKYRQGKIPFFFCQPASIVVPTEYVAWSLEDFYQIIRKIGILSVHYHLIEAKLRLGIHTNDFSHWFRNSLRKENLARQIEDIDVYYHTLEEMRKIILNHIEEGMNS